MITPIEGPPVNELQTNLPDYRTTVQRNKTIESTTENPIQKGLENFNNFVKNISQNEIQEPTKKVDYDKIARRLQEIIADENLMVEFTRDDVTKKMIFKLINAETKEIVQQIPPEVALKIARYVAATLEDQNVANAKI